MPDISMCIKKDCPSFEHCYRAQAKPNDPQIYNSFDNGEKDRCEFWLEINVGKLKKQSSNNHE